MSKYVERAEETLSHLQLQARDNLCNQEIAYYADQVVSTIPKACFPTTHVKSRYSRLSGVLTVTRYGRVCARVALLPLR